MQQVDPSSTRRKGLWATLAMAALTGVSAVTIALPTTVASADPVDPSPQPGDTGGPPQGDQGVPPEGEQAGPEPGRVDDPADGFSYVIPAGWVQSDASHLEYGSALLSKETGPPQMPGQPAPVANDTRIVLGKLDQRLYASAETDNAKAATRLGSDMGEFFMPYPGTRVNQETVPLAGNGLTGSASYYEVKFSDPAKPIGQIWTGVIGAPATGTAPHTTPGSRWFVVWLGTANNPVDKPGAKTLAESIRPLAPPPADQPPAGQPPAGQPPAGQPPAGQPPAGQPPAGQPPAGQPPAGQPPAGQPPAGQPPAGQPSAEGPAAGAPAGGTPANGTHAESPAGTPT